MAHHITAPLYEIIQRRHRNRDRHRPAHHPQSTLIQPNNHFISVKSSTTVNTSERQMSEQASRSIAQTDKRYYFVM